MGGSQTVLISYVQYYAQGATAVARFNVIHGTAKGVDVLCSSPLYPKRVSRW